MRIRKMITVMFAVVMMLGLIANVNMVAFAGAEALSVTVKKLSGNQDWAEFNYQLKNNGNEAVSGIQIKIPVSCAVNNLQSWGCTARYSDGYIVISHTAPLAAYENFSCTTDQKFGFSGYWEGAFGTPIIEIGENTGSVDASQLQFSFDGTTKELAYDQTPFGKHGKLSLQEVEGYSTPVIVDKNGQPFQLHGASTHGLHWGEMHPYVNKGAFQALRDQWGVNLIRLVAYPTQGGYTQGSQDFLDTKIQEGVKYATELGMYVIIDWHIHEESPYGVKTQAEAFFTKYASMYKDYDNVIFEICNEPTGVNWYNNGAGNDLYSYCKDIVTIIRNQKSDALIVCGTNNWSQDVDDVAKKPLKDDGFKNILYTFHFYSGSHYDDLMKKVKNAIAAGTPIFVTEFGICDASGNGGYDTANADAWIELCDKNNISYACWSFCNKNESASYLKSSCSKTQGGFLESDLTTTGIWLVNTYRAKQEAEGNTTPVIPSKPVTGLVEKDGSWIYVKEDVLQSNYTGLVSDETVGWWYVENGVINFSYNGLVQNEYGWWCVAGGRVAFEYTGLWYDRIVGWWYVENGSINFNYNGLIPYNDSWWCVAGGRVAFEYTGLWSDETVGWWYVENGMIVFAYTGFVPNELGWWCVLDGRVAFEYTGALNDANAGCWYVSDGRIDFNYNGSVMFAGSSHSVVNGMVM